MKARGSLTVAEHYKERPAICLARRIDHTPHQSFAAELNQLFGLPETRRFTGSQNYRRNLELRRSHCFRSAGMLAHSKVVWIPALSEPTLVPSRQINMRAPGRR